MLRSIDSLLGYTIAAKDGNIGSAHDFLFHDNNWSVRYLVVDTGEWLPGRKVLIAPYALGSPDFQGSMFPVNLTREKIEKSPLLDSDKPVSKRFEAELLAYYGWSSLPHVSLHGQGKVTASPEEEKGDIHLRSAKEVSGYRIEASNGSIGHVEDFIVDDDSWILRYLVIDTRNWLPGKKVLVSPRWTENVSWVSRQVEIELSREEIEKSPEYYPSEPVNREYEERLYDYYGRPHYWTGTKAGV